MKITLASLTLLLTLFAPSVWADNRRLSVSDQGGWGAALKNPAGPIGNQGFSSSEQPLKPPSVYQEKKQKEEKGSANFNQGGGVTDESRAREARRELRRQRHSQV